MQKNFIAIAIITLGMAIGTAMLLNKSFNNIKGYKNYGKQSLQAMEGKLINLPYRKGQSSPIGLLLSNESVAAIRFVDSDLALSLEIPDSLKFLIDKPIKVEGIANVEPFIVVKVYEEDRLIRESPDTKTEKLVGVLLASEAGHVKFMMISSIATTFILIIGQWHQWKHRQKEVK